jgi:predicted secreted hydrolase
LTDIDGRHFRYFQRLNRAGPGIAGASFDGGRIWNGNWQALWDKSTGTQTLSAVEDGVRMTLHLAPAKPLVIHGENGLSEKSEEPGHASHYVSFPRLTVDGSINGEKVAGSAWMDHEWFSNLIADTDQGWDWFSIQLENHTELMLFQLRKRDAAGAPFLSGTYIATDGHAVHLKPADFTLQPTEFWTSPKTSARYPVKWHVTVPSLKVSLDCTAAIPDQELVSEQRNGPTYWEGAVRYSGSSAGVGYLEMTGYAGRVRIE